MIDLTEKFFTEIATSRKYTYKGMQNNSSENKRGSREDESAL